MCLCKLRVCEFKIELLFIIRNCVNIYSLYQEILENDLYIYLLKHGKSIRKINIG